MDDSARVPLFDSLVHPWKPSPQTRYIFKGASLIDPSTGIILKNATVCTAGGSIESVSTSGTPPTTAGVVIDLDGNFILPGLIDCHVHLSAVPGEVNLRDMFTINLTINPTTCLLRQPEVCRSMLLRGFTTVRDCGGATAQLKQAIAQGVHPGPRLFIAGHALSQTGGHGDMRVSDNIDACCGGATVSVGRIVDGVGECLKYAREELRQGADFIKIMGGGGVASPTDAIEHLQFSADEIKAIVTVANNAGTYVTTHAYTPQAIRQAVQQGVKGVEHGNLIDKETAELMAQHGVYLTPTLVTYAIMARQEFSHFLPPESAKKLAEVLQSGLSAIKIAEDAGVKICFGSDLLGPLHFAQAREFGLRSKVQTPLAIIQSATINAAEMLGQSEFLGKVASGFAADFLILNANPLEDIKALDDPDSHLLATIKDGRVVASRWSKLHVETRPSSRIA